jgi:hypothetical protein
MALRFADHESAALRELRWHPEAKRIRAFVDGTPVVESTRARIVWEPRRIVPSFAVPVDDIHGSLVAAEPDAVEEQPVQLGDGPPVLDPSTGFTFHSAQGRSFDIVIGTSTLPAAAFALADADFDGYVIVDFDAFDEWREEDEVLVGHACAVRHRLGLCLQGARPVLVGAGARHRGSGRGVELRGAAQLRDVGEGHDLLLQRSGNRAGPRQGPPVAPRYVRQRRLRCRRWSCRPALSRWLEQSGDHP